MIRNKLHMQLWFGVLRNKEECIGEMQSLFLSAQTRNMMQACWFLINAAKLKWQLPSSGYPRPGPGNTAGGLAAVEATKGARTDAAKPASDDLERSKIRQKLSR